MSRSKRKVTLVSPEAADWRQRPRFWTVARQYRLAGYLEQGLSDAAIARRFGVTVEAVKLARKDFGIRARTKMHYSARDVAVLLGIGCAKTVTRWIEQGWLRGRKVAHGPHGQYRITHADLVVFLEDDHYHQCWQPGRISDASLREWASEIWTGPFLSVGEVAYRSFVGIGTVNTWIHAGHLPAVKYGNWWIRESDLEAFTPPGQLPRTGRVRDWTPEEDARLVRLRRRGTAWNAIGRMLQRWPGGCSRRYQDLTATIQTNARAA